MRIRYKLLQAAAESDAAGAQAGSPAARERLAERLEAASNISDMDNRDRTLASVVTDAAAAGEVELATRAADQINDLERRDAARRDAARNLQTRGLRKQAIRMAKAISDLTVRDNTLSELAQ